MKLKIKLIQTLIVQLEEKFKILQASALEAKEAATNEESKAENKYDTRGLEASYLAGAQAKRAKNLQDSIYVFSKIKEEELNSTGQVAMYSVLSAELEAENENPDSESQMSEKKFLIVPNQGGLTLELDGQTYFCLLYTSPSPRDQRGSRMPSSA